MQINNLTFINPEYFWGLLLIPVILYLFYKKQKQSFEFSFYKDLKKIFKNNSYKFYLKIIILFLILLDFILILANPNISNVEEKIKKNWIDIVIALDVSWSMQAEDLKPNRIEAAKNVISKFIKKLKTDRVWLVVFAWKPFTSIPLTFDYNIHLETLKRLWVETINQNKNGLNWTAIWDAILMAKTLFKPPKNESEKDYKKREKVIILLTDWDANTWVDPKIAALLAKKEKIKIYTIWIWSEKWWYISYQVWPFIQKQKIPPLNTKDLKYIAKQTQAEFFRATDNRAFEKIFQKLSSLEKNDIKVEVNREFKEYYDYFVYSLIFLVFVFFTLIIRDVEIRPLFDK